MALDTLRQRAYDAECRALFGTLAEDAMTFAELVELTEQVTATSWWQTGASCHDVRVVRARPDALSSVYRQANRCVYVSESQPTPATLAHAYADDEIGHGPLWCAVFCELTLLICGQVSARLLRAEFKAAKLRLDDTVARYEGTALLATHPRFQAEGPDTLGGLDRFAAMRDGSGAIVL